MPVSKRTPALVPPTTSRSPGCQSRGLAERPSASCSASQPPPPCRPRLVLAVACQCHQPQAVLTATAPRLLPLGCCPLPRHPAAKVGPAGQLALSEDPGAEWHPPHRWVGASHHPGNSLQSLLPCLPSHAARCVAESCQAKRTAVTCQAQSLCRPALTHAPLTTLPAGPLPAEWGTPGAFKSADAL